MHNQMHNDAEMDNDGDNPWQFRARCRGAPDAHLFFASSPGDQSLAVRRYCDRCPVRDPCLELALANDDSRPYGVFGGLTPIRRAELRAERRRSRDGPRAAA